MRPSLVMPAEAMSSAINNLESVALGLVSALALGLFYAVVRTDWPDNYSTAQSSIASGARSGPVRYLGFRFFPMLVVALLTACTAQDLGAPPAVAVITLVAAHLIATNGRALLDLALGRRRNRRAVLSVFHVASAFGVAVSGLAGWALRDALSSVVPQPQDLVLAMWTAVFVAVAGAAMRRLAAFDPGGYDVHLARLDIGEDAWVYIEEAAARGGCDPDVLKSIILAEVSQRPRWVRKLEYAKGRVLKRGSYGVAQIGSDSPLSDRASIDRLASQLCGYYPPRNARFGGVRARSLMARVASHNGNQVFCQEVVNWYQIISPPPLVGSVAVGADSRPIIEVREVEFAKGFLWVRGTALVDGEALSCAHEIDGGGGARWECPARGQSDRTKGLGHLTSPRRNEINRKGIARRRSRW